MFLGCLGDELSTGSVGFWYEVFARAGVPGKICQLGGRFLGRGVHWGGGPS